MNRKLKTTIGHVTAGVAALAMVAGATAASAQSYRHGGYYGGRGHHHHRGGDKTGAAIAGGIVGLALGAAIASNNNDRYDRGYSRYDRGYGYGYGRGYGYGYAPPPPPPRYYGGYGYGPRYGYGYGRRGRDCWTTRDYDRYSGSVYERTVCR
jgi:hypothetical protein